MNLKEAYADLSDLLFRGFLTAEIQLGGKSLIFKTVNEKEFNCIKLLAGSTDKKNYYTFFNTYFLIFSLFIIDNQNVIHSRDKDISSLYEFFLGFPERIHRKLIEKLNELQSNSYDALKYLEGFTYTDVSRNSWKILNGSMPTCSGFTGVSGTDMIGLNMHQESWIIINKMMDEEEKYSKDFSLSVLVASASNPKGAQQVQGQFNASIRNIEDRRKRLAAEGFIDVKRWSNDGWAASVDTAEELVAELYRQMEGKKDRHDIFFDKYLQKMREEAESKTREVAEKMKRAREETENIFIQGSQRALTPEEVDNLSRKKNETTVELKSEKYVDPEKRDQFYKKIGARILTGI